MIVAIVCPIPSCVEGCLVGVGGVAKDGAHLLHGGPGRASVAQVAQTQVTQGVGLGHATHGVGKTSSKSCVEAVCKGWRGSWHVVNVADHGRRCDRGLWRLWPELGRRSLRGLLHLRREVLGRVLQWRWDAPASSSGQLFVILLFVALNFLPTFLDDEVACIFCHLNALWLCLGQVCTHVADTEMFLHRWQRHGNF